MSSEVFDERFYTPRCSARSASSSQSFSSEYETEFNTARDEISDEEDTRYYSGQYVTHEYSTLYDQNANEEYYYDESDTYEEAKESYSSSKSQYYTDGTAYTDEYYDEPVLHESTIEEDYFYSRDNTKDIFSLARHNRIDDLLDMLDSGVPVNIKDLHGNSILAIACQNGLKRLAKSVLRRGCNINSKNYQGNSPLHFCYAYGYGDTLGRYLVSKGADTSLRNNAGFTCYEGLDI